MLFGSTAAARRPRPAAILGKLVKTTVVLRVEAEVRRERQSGKHGPNPGGEAPWAFVIWSRSSRQVAGSIQVIIHSAQAARGQPRREPWPSYFGKCRFLCVCFKTAEVEKINANSPEDSNVKQRSSSAWKLCVR